MEQPATTTTSSSCAAISRRRQCFLFLLFLNIGIMSVYFYQNSGDVSFLLDYGDGMHNGTLWGAGMKPKLLKMKNWFNFTKTSRNGMAPYLYPLDRSRTAQGLANATIRRHTYVDIPNNFDIYPRLNMTGIHTILLYNHQKWVELSRHNSLMSKCYYNNCRLTADKKLLHKASAIIFHYFYMGMGVVRPPIERDKRNPDQAWVFMGRESPINNHVEPFSTEPWLNTLNWSMTYLTDADIYSGYGRLTTRPNPPPDKDYDAIFDSKIKMAAWMVNKCKVQSAREVFVAELRKHGVTVDIYGGCGKERLAADKTDQVISKYKFYFSFENSFCKDYITEKFFGRYNNNYILVTRGGADYNTRLPSGTFINTADFNSIKALADHMIALSRDKSAYIDMLKRKDQYVSEGPVFGWQYSWCELCSKINNLDQNRKTYTDAAAYINNGNCWQPKDAKPYNNIRMPGVNATSSNG